MLFDMQSEKNNEPELTIFNMVFNGGASETVSLYLPNRIWFGRGSVGGVIPACDAAQPISLRTLSSVMFIEGKK